MKNKELTLEERKEYGMQVLDEIKRICQILGIRYFLAYGTLLGAIRHKGYIPWDDDIDIWVFRDDYEKLKKEFNSLCSPDFKLLSYSDTPHYPYLMTKVVSLETEVREKLLKKMDNLGIWVDIFPLDYVSESNTIAIPKMVRLEHKRWCALFRYSTLIGKIKLFFYNLIQKDTSFKDFHTEPSVFTMEIHKTHACTKKSDYVKSPTSERSIRDLVYPATCFDNSIEAEFENRKYSIPEGFDQLLHIIYGDYMKLPPAAKRKLDKHLVKVQKKNN